MQLFAKIFESQEGGQLLVKIDTHPTTGRPEVRLYAEPEGLGLCSVARFWTDNERGWNGARAYFDSLDQAKAQAGAAEMFERANSLKAATGLSS